MVPTASPAHRDGIIPAPRAGVPRPPARSANTMCLAAMLRGLLTAGCLALALPAAASAQTTPPAGPEPPPPPGKAETPAVAAPGGAAATKEQPAEPLDPTVEKILDRLERRTINDLRASVNWKSMFVVGGETTKFGELWYQTGKPFARFLVSFREKIDPPTPKMAIDERFSFDGRWFVELNAAARSITRREIRAANDPRDPYRLGVGTFPLPFGQKKADIVREFKVELVPPDSDDPPNTDHLKCTPRPLTRMAEEYSQVHFWVATGAGAYPGLPIKVMASKKDGTGKVNSIITITFDKVQLDTGFAGDIFDIKKPPGYEEIREELKPAINPPDERGERAAKKE